MSTAIAANDLCDNCHQKAKFGGHQFCGKTCAAQAAISFCVQCHQKPKHPSYDYCGKKCAAQAQAQTQKKPLMSATNYISSHGSSGLGVVKGNASARKQPTAARFIPQSLTAQAKTTQNAPTPRIGQYIQSAMAQVPGLFSSPPPLPSTPMHQGILRATPQSGVFSGNVNVVPQAQAPPPPPPPQLPANDPSFIGQQLPTFVNGYGTVPTQAAPPPPQMICGIPGCNEPVHVDADGTITSEYCSMRHREDAVASGLAPPCIMCGELPQSATDYFCSRACREESMNK